MKIRMTKGEQNVVLAGITGVYKLTFTKGSVAFANSPSCLTPCLKPSSPETPHIFIWHIPACPRQTSTLGNVWIDPKRLIIRTDHLSVLSCLLSFLLFPTVFSWIENCRRVILPCAISRQKHFKSRNWVLKVHFYRTVKC